MAISADLTPSNGLRHTAADTPRELALTTAATGSRDIAVHRLEALLDACMHT
jgi:hypothetical protein